VCATGYSTAGRSGADGCVPPINLLQVLIPILLVLTLGSGFAVYWFFCRRNKVSAGRPVVEDWHTSPLDSSAAGVLPGGDNVELQ
jgi:hypothetical protein